MVADHVAVSHSFKEEGLEDVAFFVGLDDVAFAEEFKD
jgi:hypothetical protein